jgi:hypothetical protein
VATSQRPVSAPYYLKSVEQIDATIAPMLSLAGMTPPEPRTSSQHGTNSTVPGSFRVFMRSALIFRGANF